MLGYIASLLIGVSLGLIGSGGSILTMPVMVYLFGIPPLTATSYSLFVVGSASLVGAFKNYRHGLVNIKTALLFGASSIATVFVTRRFIIPLIPHELFSVRSFMVTENLLTMVLFAVLMVVASLSMIRTAGERYNSDKYPEAAALPVLLLYGGGIGIVTGLLGAGGGFLLIPTLVLLMHMPMKEAIGTSLLIIALNALVGFAGHPGKDIHWPLLLTVTALSMAGIAIGSALSRHIPSARLKKAFGWFVLAMGVYILVKELL